MLYITRADSGVQEFRVLAISDATAASRTGRRDFGVVSIDYLYRYFCVERDRHRRRRARAGRIRGSSRRPFASSFPAADSVRRPQLDVRDFHLSTSIATS
jgi:hypothetical protein